MKQDFKQNFISKWAATVAAVTGSESQPPSDEDGAPAKPRGVRREKSQREEKVIPESSTSEEVSTSKYGATKSTYSPVDDQENGKQSEKENESNREEKEYNPTRRVISTTPSEPRKSAASK